MTDKLQKRIKENQEIAEQNIGSAVLDLHSQANQQNAWMMLGAVGAVNHLANMLTTQTIRGIQRIRDEELYRQLGFERFDDFLNESPNSPMGYRRFNEMEKLLMKEGEPLFDVLNGLKLSMRQRKQLGSGAVQIDEEKGTLVITVPVADGAAEKTEEIELNDRPRLLQTLSAVADQAASLNQKTIRQAEKIEKGEKEVERLKRDLDEAKKRPGQLSAHALHFETYLRAVNSIDGLSELLKSLPADEVDHSGRLYLSDIFNAFNRLKTAYGLDDLSVKELMRTPLAEMTDDERVAHISKKLSHNDDSTDEFSNVFSQLDENDEELAAAL